MLPLTPDSEEKNKEKVNTKLTFKDHLELGVMAGRFLLSGTIAITTAPIWISGLLVAAIPLSIAYAVWPFKDDDDYPNPF